MRKRPWNYAMFGGLVVMAVLYGIELSSKGIADVYGPLDRTTGLSDEAYYGESYDPLRQPPATDAPEQDVPSQQAPERDLTATYQDPGPEGTLQPVPAGSEPAVNRLASGTAGLLQSVASGGIRLIVSVFDAVTK